jgi:hypothetical protein
MTVGMVGDGWRLQTKLGQFRFRAQKFGTPAGESRGQTQAFETLRELAQSGQPGMQTMREMYVALHGDMGGPTAGTVASHERIHDHVEQRLRHVPYEIVLPSGEKRTGILDARGKAHIAGLPTGNCELALPDFDAGDWKLVG